MLEIFGSFCPRGFAIPEVGTADFLSARVTNPQSTPCGFEIHRDGWTSVVSIIVSLSSGICNPRDNNHGFSIRVGRRPTVIALWIRKSTGTESLQNPICFSLVYVIVNSLPAFSFLRSAGEFLLCSCKEEMNKTPCWSQTRNSKLKHTFTPSQNWKHYESIN